MYTLPEVVSAKCFI